jgi:ribose-phosphate pyrophosphokinase
MSDLLFALPHHEALAAAIACATGIERGRVAVGRFANGELRVTSETPCADRRCVLLGASAPPDGDLLVTSLLAHTLGKDGAREVLAVIPYLGYARQDRAELGKSLGVAWVGRVLAGVGVAGAVSVDVHSARAVQLFGVRLRSLSAAAIFADALRALALEDATVVAPDEGARERADAVRVALGIDRPVVSFVKRRAETGIRHIAVQGQVGRSAIVVDDILDTGGTLVSACERLREAGTRTIVVAVTHGLFTGTAWERLWDLGVDRIYCTDTTPRARIGDDRVCVLSIAPVLAGYLSAARH